MAEKVCPHCNHPVPPEFAVMPVCTMCGGDLNAQATQVWSAVDIQGGGRQICPACHTEVKSVLATECPQCQAPLQPGVTALAAVSLDTHLDTILEEPTPVVQPEPVGVAQPKSEPVSLPSFVSEPVAAARPEPKSEPKPAPPVAKEGFFSKLLRMLGLKK